METKLFVTNLADARWWGDRLYSGAGYQIALVDIPEALAGRLYQDTFDRRHVAAVYPELLAEFNAAANISLP